MATPVTPDVLESPAVGILCQLADDGFQVELTADGILSIAPRSRLTPERMAAIAEHKDALRTLVRVCDDGVQDRREVFARQLEAAKPGTVPAFLFTPGLPYVAGSCFSCAAALEGPRFGRCWRCALAWRLACRLPIPVESATAHDGAKVVA